jgi:hypothetical protein
MFRTVAGDGSEAGRAFEMHFAGIDPPQKWVELCDFGLVFANKSGFEWQSNCQRVY